ncbi:AMP-binding protein [Streptomyces sp. H27-D2]|uniref:AMP-binding protein n=1 Tax=Streptomyces sp. H27-D2 TaxID=3046304 RepID=UPI002DBD8E40|nr:AMP-binding protein [Streptomyces sp. H27-D2]MEC4019149.1 AMP-binding protein [Streptomyces sp. H27-D2]
MTLPADVVLPPGDPRVPSREQCVVGSLLAERARAHPARVYAVFEDGGSWTYREAYEAAAGTAVALHRQGVRRGDAVLSWLPNGRDALRVWFGVNLLGGVHVPLNTAYRGRLLEHVIANSGSRLLVAHGRLAQRLTGVDPGGVEQVIVLGDATEHGAPETGAPRAPRFLGPEALDGDAADFSPPADPVEPWDTMAVIYTSGTTGPSKGVLVSYVHHYSTVTSLTDDELVPEDRYLLNLPLFHGGGTEVAYCMLFCGGSIAVVEGFDTHEFWDVVRKTRVTMCTLIGAMTDFLVGLPAGPDDREHTLRAACVMPLTREALEFGRRYGVDVYTGFNMSETSAPLVSELNPDRVGSCGRPRPGVQCRVVDEHDLDVPDGTAGELIVRADRPWSMFHGYQAMPEATVRAWRNGWFHTGDALYREASGDYFFVDRIKDAIRRRGENISSVEVEAEILAHPSVAQAAVVAVPSEYAEDEILAVVAPVPGGTVEPAELIEFLRPRLAHFMIPRYLRTLPELPQTPTGKVLKADLREQGVGADTWDRSAAGVEVKRERLR